MPAISQLWVARMRPIIKTLVEKVSCAGTVKLTEHGSKKMLLVRLNCIMVVHNVADWGSSWYSAWGYRCPLLKLGFDPRLDQLPSVFDAVMNVGITGAIPGSIGVRPGHTRRARQIHSAK